MVGLFFKWFENYIVGEEIGECQSLRMGREEEYGESYLGVEQGISLWWWSSSVSILIMVLVTLIRIHDTYHKVHICACIELQICKMISCVSIIISE